VSKLCHHPQGGFCEHCRAPGLNDREAATKLVGENYQHVAEFVAYFVEGSSEMCSCHHAIEQTLIRWIEADMRRRRRERNGELDYVPE
jgi:hypothetical protein